MKYWCLKFFFVPKIYKSWEVFFVKTYLQLYIWGNKFYEIKINDFALTKPNLLRKIVWKKNRSYILTSVFLFFYLFIKVSISSASIGIFFMRFIGAPDSWITTSSSNLIPMFSSGIYIPGSTVKTIFAFIGVFKAP